MQSFHYSLSLFSWRTVPFSVVCIVCLVCNKCVLPLAALGRSVKRARFSSHNAWERLFLYMSSYYCVCLFLKSQSRTVYTPIYITTMTKWTSFFSSLAVYFICEWNSCFLVAHHESRSKRREGRGSERSRFFWQLRAKCESLQFVRDHTTRHREYVEKYSDTSSQWWSLMLLGVAYFKSSHQALILIKFVIWMIGTITYSTRLRRSAPVQWPFIGTSSC